jgi:hypothetical protein
MADDLPAAHDTPDDAPEETAHDTPEEAAHDTPDDPPNQRPDDLLQSLRLLLDDELVARLKGLAARERRTTALLVAHLAELDTRDVYLRAGYPSLFAYCRDVLALSDGEAYDRIEVARTARRFPRVLDLLGAGEASLTTIRLLGPHLTSENHEAVLDSARGKRKSEVEEIGASLSRRADVAPSLRKLPVPKSACGMSTGIVAQMAGDSSPKPDPEGTATAAQVEAASHSEAVAVPARVGVAVAFARSRRPADVEPLSPNRYRYQLTIGGATLETLSLQTLATGPGPI